MAGIVEYVACVSDENYSYDKSLNCLLSNIRNSPSRPIIGICASFHTSFLLLDYRLVFGILKVSTDYQVMTEVPAVELRC